MQQRLPTLIVAAIVVVAGLAAELIRRSRRERNRQLPERSHLDLSTATRQALYEEAQRQEIKGRSKMNKAQLRAALTERGQR